MSGHLDFELYAARSYNRLLAHDTPTLSLLQLLAVLLGTKFRRTEGIPYRWNSELCMIRFRFQNSDFDPSWQFSIQVQQ